MLKNIILILSLIFLVFSCSKNNESDKNILKIGMELQYPPFETIDKNGMPYGISVEIAEKLGKALNKKIKIIPMSWAGLIPALESSNVDLVLSSMTITEERKKRIDFSTPYAKMSLGILIRANSKAESFNDLIENENLKIAVKSGTTASLIANEKLKQEQISVFDDVSVAIMDLLQGNSDVFLYDALTILKEHQKNPKTTRINLEAIEGSESFWAIALKKGNLELKKEIDNFLETAKKEGTLKAIAKKYLENTMEFYEKNNLEFML